MTTITYDGYPPKLPSLQVPGWGGQEDGFQPWQLMQFAEAVDFGIEILYPYDTTTVIHGNEPPFRRISDKYYQLELNTIMSVPLLIVPHYRYYTTENAPLPITSFWEPCPLPITLTFKLTTPTTFNKDDPIAQAIPIERRELKITEMNEKDKLAKLADKDFILSESDKYITRRVITSTGQEMDNLYNVLTNMSRAGKSPIKQRSKYQIVKMGSHKKTQR